MSMRNTRTLRTLVFTPLVALVALCIPHPSSGQASIPGYPTSIYAFDPRELALLPPYCIYTQRFGANVPGGNNAELMCPQ